MKIVTATIYGFGKWVDTSFDFSKDNDYFVCYYGENESGKTTLQQFILYVLFGLAPKNRQAMKPKESNKFGGKLTLFDDEPGHFVIERIDNNVRCFLPDGIEEDAQWLEQYLNGRSRQMMTDIYSFSAIDLDEIRNFDEEELTEVLFSVGLSGVTDIYRTEKKLKTMTADLFRPQGKVRQINLKLTELSDAYTNLQNFLEKEATYISLKDEQETTTQQLERNKILINKVKSRLKIVQQIEGYLPQIKEYEQNLIEYNKLSNGISFPENGVDRYENLLEFLLPLKASLNNLIENEVILNEQLDTINHQMYPEQHYEEIKQLLSYKQPYDELNLSLNQLENQLETIEFKINESTQKIGIEEGSLLQYNFPFQLENDWKEFANNEQRLLSIEQELQQSKTNIITNRQGINDEIKMIKEQQLPLEKLTNIRQKINNHHMAEQKSIDESKKDRKIEETIQKQDKLSTVIFTTILFMLIGLVLVSFLIDNNFLIIISVILLATNSLIWFGFRKYLSSLNNLMQETGQEDTVILEQDEYNQLQKKMQTADDLSTSLKMLEIKLGELNSGYQLINNDIEQLEIEQTKWQEDKLEIIKQYPFLEKVPVNRWIDLYQLLQKIKQDEGQRDLLTEQKRRIETNIKHIEEQLQQLSVTLQWGYDRLTFHDLDKIMIDFYKNDEIKNDYETQIAKNRNEQQLQKGKKKLLKEEIKTLFSFAGVNNEEEFYRTNEFLLRKRKLKNQLLNFEQQMENTFSSTLKEEILEKGWDGEKVSIEIMSVDDELQGLEKNQENLTRNLLGIEHKIREIEKSEQFSQAAFNFQMKRDEVNELAEQWAIYQVALSTLQNAKKRYQDKHLTNIIKETTSYFKRLTSKKYINVYPPKEKTGFQVEEIDGTRYNIAELSQGTVNQLYVALRLAIARVMSKRISFPFIIDDAFVHFDSIRSSQMIKILKEIASETQVLLFTCKKDIADMCGASNLQDKTNTIETY